jgi:hypothetical protein
MDGAASRRPGHPFSLNPNSGPVCPASNIGVALFTGLFRICPPVHARRVFLAAPGRAVRICDGIDGSGPECCTASIAVRFFGVRHE